MSRTRTGQPPVILLNCAAVFLGRRAFVSKSQIRASALLLQVAAQFQFELTQRFDDCFLDVRGRCGVAVHAAVHGFSRLHWLVDVVRLLRTTSDETWEEVTVEAASQGAIRGLALATSWADHLEPNRRRIAMPSRTGRRVQSLAHQVMPGDQTKIHNVESLGVKVRLNGDPRYVANQVARWAVPPLELGSVGARPPLAFVLLPLRQLRMLTGRVHQRSPTR